MLEYGSGPGPILVPALAVTLFLTAAAFGLGSQAAPIVLLVGATLMMFYAYHLHKKQFAADYKYSTWENDMRPMAPFAMVGVVLVLLYGAFALTSETGLVGGRRGRR